MKRIVFLIAFLLYAGGVFAAAPTPVQCKDQIVVELTSSPTVLATFDSTPTTGNRVVVIMAGQGFVGTPVLATLTDNKGNSYTVDHTATVASTNTFSVAAGHATITSTGSSFTVSGASDGNTFYPTITICEVPDLDPTTPFEAATTNTAGGGSSSITVTRSGANTTNNAFVIGALVASTTVTVSAPASGYTEGNHNDVGEGLSTGYKTVTSIETSSIAWTYTVTAESMGIIAVYKGIDASPSTGSPQRSLIGVGK